MRTVEYSSAGGVVVDEGSVLILERPSRGEVRLPKGHIESGESAEGAALREVEEESGHGGLEILADLGRERVRFTYKGARVRREERYFLMRAKGGRNAGAGRPEKQFEPRWIPFEAALKALSFEIEREWVRRAMAVCESLRKGSE